MRWALEDADADADVGTLDACISALPTTEFWLESDDGEEGSSLPPITFEADHVALGAGAVLNLRDADGQLILPAGLGATGVGVPGDGSFEVRLATDEPSGFMLNTDCGVPLTLRVSWQLVDVHTVQLIVNSDDVEISVADLLRRARVSQFDLDRLCSGADQPGVRVGDGIEPLIPLDGSLNFGGGEGVDRPDEDFDLVVWACGDDPYATVKVVLIGNRDPVAVPAPTQKPAASSTPRSSVGASQQPTLSSPWAPEAPVPAPLPSRSADPATCALPVLRFGSRGAGVADLQRLLGLVPDGIFGPKTLMGVLAFQRSHGLAVDGIVGPITCAALLTEPSPTVNVWVRHGSRGMAVREVQQLVGVTVDGIFGPRTLAAVKAYQRARGLQVDGIVGPRTWASLLGEAGQ
jgi:peptidoglycan hydrolase-like protein with peptidoglycan-binding domain